MRRTEGGREGKGVEGVFAGGAASPLSPLLSCFLTSCHPFAI